MLQCFRLISLFIGCWLIASNSKAQITYPTQEGQPVRYELSMEMPHAYVSGLLIMAKQSEETVNASIINEFGVSLIDFSYNETKQKIKLHHVMKKLNKWFIKRMLRHDLREILTLMREGKQNSYQNKQKINYQFELFHDTEK